MTPEEFRFQIKEALDQILNQLQNATLLVAQLEQRISETGSAAQVLGQLAETYSAQSSPPRNDIAGQDNADR
ncbi:MAG TPA: hypothetical protein V6D10_23055 [Trichocoleus sp.]|jgi:hypothetical protein